jgi:hypothetical protein
VGRQKVRKKHSGFNAKRRKTGKGFGQLQLTFDYGKFDPVIVLRCLTIPLQPLHDNFTLRKLVLAKEEE